MPFTGRPAGVHLPWPRDCEPPKGASAAGVGNGDRYRGGLGFLIGGLVVVGVVDVLLDVVLDGNAVVVDEVAGLVAWEPLAAVGVLHDASSTVAPIRNDAASSVLAAARGGAEIIPAG
ncbi:MAG: hypothetical protein ACYDGN_06700 [Acidimicrobiales bacterium]